MAEGMLTALTALHLRTGLAAMAALTALDLRDLIVRIGLAVMAALMVPDLRDLIVRENFLRSQLIYRPQLSAEPDLKSLEHSAQPFYLRTFQYSEFALE